MRSLRRSARWLLLPTALATPEMREYYATQNVEVLLMNPVEFAAKVWRDHDRLGKLIRDAGLRSAN